MMKPIPMQLDGVFVNQSDWEANRETITRLRQLLREAVERIREGGLVLGTQNHEGFILRLKKELGDA